MYYSSLLVYIYIHNLKGCVSIYNAYIEAEPEVLSKVELITIKNRFLTDTRKLYQDTIQLSTIFLCQEENCENYTQFLLFLNLDASV